MMIITIEMAKAEEISSFLTIRNYVYYYILHKYYIYYIISIKFLFKILYM